MGSTYSGQIIAPWNSEIGTATDAVSTFTAQDTSGENPVSGDINGYRGINEDPNIVMKLNNPASSGYVEYNAYWKSEDQAAISSGAVALKDLDSTLTGTSNKPTNRIPEDKFTYTTVDGVQVSGISATWGLYSLPGGPDYYDTTANADATEFAAARANFLQSIGGDTGSVFALVVAVNNFIQNEILSAISAGTLTTDITSSQPDAAGTMDAAYYFYKAIQPNSNLQWGLKDVLPGYVNMLRALGIPARLVTGFAGGDINNINGVDTLQLTFYNTHYWIEALIPWIDNQGVTHFTWGEFNPIPIFSVLQNQGIPAYGRNALGTNPNMTLNINSGSNELAGSPYKLHTMGDDFDFSVNVAFDGNPAPGQIINFRLVGETDLNSMNSGGFDPTSGVPGIDIGSTVTNASGIAQVTGKVFLNGTMELSNGTKRANTIQPLDVTALLNPGGGDPTNAYGIIALFGLNYAYNGTGWIKNGTIISSVLDKTQVVPNGAVYNGTAYTGIPEEIFHLKATIFKTDLSEEIPAQELSLLMFPSADFQTLDINDPTLITQGKTNAAEVINSTATMTTNATSGTAEWFISFPFGGTFPTNNQLYIFVVYWEGSLITSDPIGIIMINDVTLSTSALFTGTPVLNSGNPSITGWTITSSATSASALIAGGSGNVADLQLQYWLINAQIYDNSPATSWTLFNSRYLQNSSVTENVHYYNLSKGVGSPATSYATGGDKTDTSGTASTILTLSITDLAAGYYYIFVGAADFDKFIQQKNSTDANAFVFVKQDTLQVNAVEQQFNLQINDGEITTATIQQRPDFTILYVLIVFITIIGTYISKEVIYNE